MAEFLDDFLFRNIAITLMVRCNLFIGYEIFLHSRKSCRHRCIFEKKWLIQINLELRNRCNGNWVRLWTDKDNRKAQEQQKCSTWNVGLCKHLHTGEIIEFIELFKSSTRLLTNEIWRRIIHQWMEFIRRKILHGKLEYLVAMRFCNDCWQKWTEFTPANSSPMIGPFAAREW